MLWLVLGLASDAAPPRKPPAPRPPEWETEWYGRPRANVRAIRVGGVSAAQAIVGAEGGLRYSHAPVYRQRRKWKRGPADVVGRTRLRGDVFYGLTSQSLGFDVRLGSFVGPTSRYITYQFGPDIWFNGYGSEVAEDYFLPYSLGIDVTNQVVFHIARSVNAQLQLTPGWAFDKDRQTGGLGPIHELTGAATLSVQTGAFTFVVGYQRIYNAAGVTDGLILSGGL